MQTFKTNAEAGTMGLAILSGVLDSCAKSIATGKGAKITCFIATVNSQRSANALRQRFLQHSSLLKVTTGDNVQAMAEADIIIWAFKPYMVDEVLRVKGVREAIAGKLVISVLVGSPIAKLEDAAFHHSSRPSKKILFIKRAMPNVGAEYGQSMTVIEATKMEPYHEEISDWIFVQVGKISSVAPELFDIAGVLAGASSALMSVAFDGILDGAVSQGLKRADATKILTQSLVSLAACLENGEHPAILREKISSPKGTTIAGLLSLEEDRARFAYTKATIASTKRSQEITLQK